MISESKILIFDLDGTLIKSNRFDDQCFQQAVKEVLGHSNFNTDWKTYQNVTDTGLLNEMLTKMGIQDIEPITIQVRNIFGIKIREYLDNGGICNEVPGAIETISKLQSSGYKIGIATGGWAHTAKMKLKHVGFSEIGIISSCDDAVDRPGIMLHCYKRLGGTTEPAIYFGDASWDIEATDSLGWQFIGIGDFFSDKCDDWIRDYNDPKWLLSLNSL